MKIVALIASVLLGVVALFQIALACGAPFGRAAWGGQQPGVLPSRLRVMSGVAGAVVYPAIIVTVLAAGGIAGDWLGAAARPVMWVLTAIFGIGTVMNAVSRSPLERIWAPVVLVIAVCCGVVAFQL